MTKRRRIVWVLGAVALCLFLTLATWLIARNPTQAHPVNRESFARIREGMTRAEVENLFQSPPVEVPSFEAEGGLLCQWHGHRAVASVVFSEDGRVLRFNFSEGKPATPIDHVLFWLGW